MPARLAGATRRLIVELAPGQPAVAAEAEMRLAGFWGGVDGSWTCQCAVHTLDARSYPTDVRTAFTAPSKTVYGPFKRTSGPPVLRAVDPLSVVGWLFGHRSRFPVTGFRSACSVQRGRSRASARGWGRPTGSRRHAIPFRPSQGYTYVDCNPNGIPKAQHRPKSRDHVTSRVSE